MQRHQRGYVRQEEREQTARVQFLSALMELGRVPVVTVRRLPWEA
jgi:hypothetical protein